jgi:hypothetical protein
MDAKEKSGFNLFDSPKQMSTSVFLLPRNFSRFRKDL